MGDYQHLFGDPDRFPTLPDVVVRIQRELADPECDIRTIAGMIELDPVISAHIVRIANSPLFGASNGFQSVERAVMRLGLSQTRNAVMSIALLKLVPELPEPYDVRDFWMLGLGTAMVARKLATSMTGVDPEQAYLVGLVHEIGALYLAVAFPDRFARAMGALADAGDSALAIEREFGVGLPIAGAMLLQEWNFPQVIASAVQYQLDPENAPEARELALIVFSADRICRDLGLGVGSPAVLGPWVQQIPAAFRAELAKQSGDDVLSHLSGARDDLDEIAEFARSVYSADAG